MTHANKLKMVTNCRTNGNRAMKKPLDSKACGAALQDSPVRCLELDPGNPCGSLPNQDFL